MATVVTRKGKEILSGRMMGSTPSQGEPKFLAWGTNPNSLTAANTDVAEFAEPSADSRTSGTSSQITTTFTNDTYQVTGTQTATGSRTIQEAALSDSSTQPSQGAVAAGTSFIGNTTGSSGLTLNTASTFSPGNNNYVQIRTEVFLVTAGSGSTSLTVTRAQNGSAATAAIALSDVVTPGNIPGLATVSGGSMFAHADLSAINLNNGDSITWTWKVQFT